MVRFADDFIIVFSREEDAYRVMEVLPKRFDKYGLALHPEKTRLVRFDRPGYYSGPKGGGGKPQSFDFLGFTHYWGRSRKKNWVIKRKTAKGRFARAVNAVFTWCRDNRHKKREEQNRKLSEKLRGHYQYYGITGNSKALKYFYREVEKSWHYWLGRRSQRGYMSWDRFRGLLKRLSLPQPKCVHSELRNDQFQRSFGFA